MQTIKLGLVLTLFSISFGVFGNNNTDSSSVDQFKRSFGYGASNLLDLVNPIGYRPGIYVEFGQDSPFDGWDYAFTLIGAYRFENQNNIRYHELIPFVITAGLEKNWYFEKVFISLNLNLFYSMSLRKTSISPFQGDDYGVGASPGLKINLPLRDDLVLNAGYEYGLGFFREFVGVGSVAVPAMVLRGRAIRNFSFGVRHYF